MIMPAAFRHWCTGSFRIRLRTKNKESKHASVKRDLKELNKMFTLGVLYIRQIRAEAHICGGHL